MKKNYYLTIFTFIITLTCFIPYSKAQIVYTDVTPDSVINGSYNLDLNNDGIPDFIITDSTWNINCPSFPAINDIGARITALGNNAVLSDADNYPYCLLPNYAIAPDSLTWSSTPNQTLYALSYSSTPCGRGNYCLGNSHLLFSLTQFAFSQKKSQTTIWFCNCLDRGAGCGSNKACRTYCGSRCGVKVINRKNLVNDMAANDVHHSGSQTSFTPIILEVDDQSKLFENKRNVINLHNNSSGQLMQQMEWGILYADALNSN